jgi:hypothetical protein
MEKRRFLISAFRSCSGDYTRDFSFISGSSDTPNALAPHRLAPHALSKEEHGDDEAHVCEVKHLEPPFCFSPLPLTASDSL